MSAGLDNPSAKMSNDRAGSQPRTKCAIAADAKGHGHLQKTFSAGQGAIKSAVRLRMVLLFYARVN